MLPISTSEPAVLNVAIALGSLNQPGGDCHPQESDEFALRHYSKAMKALQSKIAEQDTVAPELILITCLMFVAFEFQQNGWLQAKSHLEGGLTFIRELLEGHQQSLPPKQVLEPLVEAFERLDVSMSLFTSSRVHLNRAIEGARMASLPSEMQFRNLVDAGRPLNLQIAAMRELVYTIEKQRFSPEGLSAEDYRHFGEQQLRQLVSLKHWDRAMMDLLPRLSKAKDQRAARILQTQHLGCQLKVSECLTDGREMLWDRYQADFERLLDLAEEVVKLEAAASSPSSDNGTSNYTPGFSVDMGVVPPVYFTAMKCRKPTLRRRAVAILRSCKHREGAWDGQTSAGLAVRIITLEEQGLGTVENASDVPEQQRLYEAYFDLICSQDVIYCKRRLFESDGSWSEVYQQRVEFDWNV